MATRLLRTLILPVAGLAWLIPPAIVLADQNSQPQSAPNPIHWKQGPFTAKLGDNAEIEVPKDFLFVDGDGARKFMELNQNPTDGNEVGLITPKSEKENWFVLFEFDSVGYVKDDDRSSIDGDALLKSIQEGTEDANKTRKEKGWPAFHVMSWYTPPFYDQVTHNLTWAINGEEDKGANPAVNYSIRILGRRGTMRVDLVLGPDEMSTVEPAFKSMMGGFRFGQGNRYADFASGDKLAGYGLTALIAGGAGAVAAKTGLLAKFWKLIVAMFVAMWKFLIVVFAAIGTYFKRIWAKIKGIFSRKEPDERAIEAPDGSSTSADGPAALTAQAGEAGADISSHVGD